MSGRRHGIVFLTVVLAAFTAYTWIARPAFIWGAPPPPPSTEVQEANLKMAMFLFGMRVDKYKLENRAYPGSLEALGDSVHGIRYERTSDSTFELRGTAGNREVVFRNDMRADEFLGNTRELIQSRRRR